jgi:tRNA-specific 2-thiouridylase
VKENVIYVSNGYGTDKQYGRTLMLDEMHFISGNPWGDSASSVDIMFKNRHTPHIMRGKLTHVEDRRWVIESEEDVQGIAPGQFAVIYDTKGELCFGSGIITN